jgi:predicted nuclease with TOPRIM domain
VLFPACFPTFFRCHPQSSKLQALYTQTQAALEESDSRVTQLTAELSAAQQEAEQLRNDMRNLQVRQRFLNSRRKEEEGEKVAGLPCLP